MPKGVEHETPNRIKNETMNVINSVMPKGVEHMIFSCSTGSDLT
mgnify:CR=1 FL=1